MGLDDLMLFRSMHSQLEKQDCELASHQSGLGPLVDGSIARALQQDSNPRVHYCD